MNIYLYICLRCEGSSDSLGKPDDIQALEKKLRSLFMDLGGGVASTDILTESVFSPSTAGTSSPLGPSSTSTISVTAMANPPQQPSSLALGSLGSSTQPQGPGTPTSTTAQSGRYMHVSL